MSTTAVVGLRTVKGLLGSSPYYSDVSDKLSCSGNLRFIFVAAMNLISSKRSPNYGHGFIYSRDTHSIRALKEHVDTALDLPSTDQWVQKFDHLDEEVSEHELSVEALLLLHKSLLEKHWTLSTERTTTANPPERNSRKVHVTGSGISARSRRIGAQNKTPSRNCSVNQVGGSRQLRSIFSPELLQNCQRGYLKGVRNEALLTQSEVVALSEKIKIGLHLEEEKSR
ncbi:hypothetical protein L6452_23353 [Arctium lappa]|uniref:Uncharacterized protein n=1 Tax=Arctium lappa TaxID=4217 RepID=A0ACB9B2N3_ARCLA|nr:hypothetical protein L6452_23353 [Arctium lappa]